MSRNISLGIVVAGLTYVGIKLISSQKKKRWFAASSDLVKKRLRDFVCHQEE